MAQEKLGNGFDAVFFHHVVRKPRFQGLGDATNYFHRHYERQSGEERNDFKLKNPRRKFHGDGQFRKYHQYFDLKGKVVFMNFWASWCPPCRAEFPSIQKFYERYKDNPGVIFLTVNLDEDPGVGEAYLKKEQFTVPFLVPAGAIPSVYFSGSLPTTVVLDKNGGIRLQHAGMADYSKASFYKEIDALLDE